MSKAEKPSLTRKLGNFLFGHGDKTLQYEPLEELGLQFKLDWHLARRLEKQRELREKISTETNPDKRLEYVDELFDEVALFYGVPGSNTQFFIKHRAWEMLLGNYGQARAAGLEPKELPITLIDLKNLGKIAISASITIEQLATAKPIVIFTPNVDNRFSGFKNDGKQHSEW
jgi:hypothetical protein